MRWDERWQCSVWFNHSEQFLATTTWQVVVGDCFASSMIVQTKDGRTDGRRLLQSRWTDWSTTRSVWRRILLARDRPMKVRPPIMTSGCEPSRWQSSSIGRLICLSIATRHATQFAVHTLPRATHVGLHMGTVDGRVFMYVRLCKCACVCAHVTRLPASPAKPHYSTSTCRLSSGTTRLLATDTDSAC